MSHPIASKFLARRILIIKFVVATLPVVAFFVLLNHHLLLTSSLTYRYRPGQPARVISPIGATYLVRSADPTLRWRFSSDIFPFQVSIPRVIESVRVRGRLQIGTQPTVWLKAEGLKNADMRTLVYSEFLNSLDWKKVSTDTTTLWIRDKRTTTEKVVEGEGKNKKETSRTWTKEIPQYPTVQAFIDNPPDLSSVSSIGIDRLALANLSNVELPAGGVSLPQIFRGSHQLYVYAPTGDLKISFDKIDRNRNKNADSLTVRIARAEELSSRQPKWQKTLRVKDDGNDSANGPKGDPQKVELTLAIDRPGAYFIDLDTSEDVLITNLTSSSAMLSFSGRVFLAEGPAYGEKDFRTLTMLTNGSTLALAPAHEQGKQDLTIAGKKYSLKGVNVDVEVNALRGITSFEVARPDVKISSDGLLTVSPAKSFPSAGTVPLNLAKPNLDDVDYVFAVYRPTNGLVADFDETYGLGELSLDGKHLSFSVEAPNLKIEGTTLALEELKVSLLRGSFPWDKIWKRLGGAR